MRIFSFLLRNKGFSFSEKGGVIKGIQTEALNFKKFG